MNVSIHIIMELRNRTIHSDGNLIELEKRKSRMKQTIRSSKSESNIKKEYLENINIKLQEFYERIHGIQIIQRCL
jgi:ribulose 1,5-bisphosphate carboxylase large subunit-like protein